MNSDGRTRTPKAGARREFLAFHTGTVVAGFMIRKHLWDEQVKTVSDVVDVSTR